MSGLLVYFSLMRQLDRTKGSINIFHVYIYRYLRYIIHFPSIKIVFFQKFTFRFFIIRLTPLLAIVLAFMAYLSPLIATGPDWHFMRQYSEAIREQWWTQLLYISNYVTSIKVDWNGPKQGMGEIWYLVCDMQMFWLSPLFIYPLWKWKKAGPAWVLFCLFAFLGASTIPFITIPDLIPTMFLPKP